MVAADDDNQVDNDLQEPFPRQRTGHKRSKAAHNVEGISEGTLKRQRQAEDAPQRYFKKRHLKDLGEAEVNEIIAATKLPYSFQKDVAKQYRISAKLVGDLVRESVKHPQR